MAEEYVHRYTGAEIDEAVGKAMPTVDYIVEQGEVTTTGSLACNWYYEKYASGRFVAYMSGTLSSSIPNDSKSATVALPFRVPSTYYNVQLSPTTNSNLLVNMGVRDTNGNATKSTTQFVVYALLSSASEYSIGVDIVVRGRWM